MAGEPPSAGAPAPPVCWYAVLGVAPDADLDTLRAAWRGLARQWHPDRGHTSEDARHRFHLVQEAWRILGEPATRSGHDAARRAFADAVAPLPQGFIERLVGVRASEPSRGRNRLYRLAVDVRDVITGRSVTLEVPESQPCAACGASGLGPLGRPLLCSRCGGRCFRVERPVLRAVGVPCASCDAAGWIPDLPCGTCGGTGRVEGQAAVTVSIPPGVTEGQILRVPGRGEVGAGGGPPGDLEIHLQLRAQGPFRLDGRDWEADLPVAFWLACLGGAVEAETPFGSRGVPVPPMTREGDLLRLPGYGVGRRGDGYYRVRLVWPDDLTPAERDALRAWGEAVDARRAGAEPEVP